MKKNTILKVLEIAFYAAFILMILWLIASWMDIVADNVKPNPDPLHPWNAKYFFDKLFALMDKLF